MSNKLDLKDKWVIVTGASSGLGRQMCIDLSETYHANIIALARREDKLLSLKERISKTSKIKTVSLDVNDSQALEVFFKEMAAQLEISYIILNAGITKLKADHEIELEFKKQMINTNVMANVEIMHLGIDYFLKNNVTGGLLIVSSLAATAPVPGQALYSGTKSFLYNYASAIKWELRKRPIQIAVCVPSGIKTEMINESHVNSLEKYLIPVEDASKKILSGFAKGKSIIALTLSDRFLLTVSPLIPRSIFNRITDLVYKGLY